jgi:predicted nicotinamide N-methyase
MMMLSNSTSTIQSKTILPIIKGSNVYVHSTNIWESLLPTISSQVFGRKRARHGLAVIIPSPNTFTIVLAPHYKNSSTCNNDNVSLHIAVTAAAAILQHGEAVNVIVPNSNNNVEFYPFLCELVKSTGSLYYLTNQTYKTTTSTTSSSDTTTLITKNSMTNHLENQFTNWSTAMFPLGPTVHDMLRTTNGIHFSKAAEDMVSISLLQQPNIDILQSNTDDFDGLGAVVWQCGEVLCQFFESLHGNNIIHNKIIYDLGCGTGLVGIVAAMCGAKKVILSDRQQIVDLAKLNVEKNIHLIKEKDIISFEVYEWKENVNDSLSDHLSDTNDNIRGNQSGEKKEKDEKEVTNENIEKNIIYDVVVISDGLYDCHSFEGLFETIQTLLEKNGNTLFLFGYKMRHPLREYTFFRRLENELGLRLLVYKQSCIQQIELRGVGIFIVEALR